MAAPSLKTSLFCIFIFIFLGNSLVFSANEFQVGGLQGCGGPRRSPWWPCPRDGHGWVVPPPSNESKVYNEWASKNTFRVGDALWFKYKKDSVMEMPEEDYKKCNSTRPKFFDNSGNSVYRLARLGSFYFISGAAGHCKKGQSMIVKVLTSDDDESRKSAGFRGAVSELGVSKLVFVQFVLFYVASILL